MIKSFPSEQLKIWGLIIQSKPTAHSEFTQVLMATFDKQITIHKWSLWYRPNHNLLYVPYKIWNRTI